MKTENNKNNITGGLLALQWDLNFWTLFILVTLMTSLMLVSMTLLSNILCCAILGAYAIIYPMDFYLGSNLKYIMINIIRRATVPEFNKAVLSPPFEWRGNFFIFFLCISLIWKFAMLIVWRHLYFFKTYLFWQITTIFH